ncbi:Uncharacterised protein [Candidatus Anstonella stagnisolia]|nr:Uncharacterised protein [Candidatus Anstonella stagnisolia]
MRKEEEIRKKLQEVIAANAKRRLPSPERIDIMNGLSFLLQKGKYETLRDWELRKAEVNKIAATFDKEDYRYRYCRRGLRGERIYDEKFESNGWVLASYVWALQIQDPAEMTILAYELNRRKRMLRLENK